MNVIEVDVNTLKPAPYNPRQASEKQFNDLKESIQKHGFVEPVLANMHPGRENTIIGGHLRVKVAKELGMKQVPVTYIDLDEENEKELCLRLNKNHGEWDWDKLTAFEKDHLIKVGFDEVEIDRKFDIKLPDDKDVAPQDDKENEPPHQRVECPKCHFEFDVKK